MSPLKGAKLELLPRLSDTETLLLGLCGSHTGGQRGAEGFRILISTLQLMADLLYDARGSILGAIRTWYAGNSDAAPHLTPPAILTRDCRAMATLRRHVYNLQQ